MKKVIYSFLLIFALVAASNATYADNTAVITIYNPPIGVEWVKGTTHNITWYYGYSYDVKIELLYGGSAVDILSGTSSVTVENTGSWEWTIPTYLDAGNYKIRITSTHNPSSTATTGVFKLVSQDPNLYITMYSPAVGVQWLKGREYNITWWSNLEDANLKIELWKLESGTYTKVTTVTGFPGTGMVPNDNLYTWTIPTTDGFEGTYKIKLKGEFSSKEAFSGYFKVVKDDPNLYITIYNPALGVKWIKGREYDITWQTNLEDATVDIELWKQASGGTYTKVDTYDDVPNVNSYTWTAVNAGTYKFKIVGIGKSVFSAYFRVVDVDPNLYITIYNPAQGVQWIAGREYNLTWWTNIEDDNLVLKLFKLDGVSGTYDPVTADVLIENNGTYPWTVPTGGLFNSGTFKIQLSQVSGTGKSVKSAYFKIINYDPSLYITVYNPALGVEWIAGKDYNITWQTNLEDANLTLSLYQLISGTYTQVTTTGLGSVPNDGIYNWTIPTGQALGRYKIEISGTNKVVKSAYFKIVKFDPMLYLTIHSPAAGVWWAENNEYNITWTSNTEDSEVDISLLGPGGTSTTVATWWIGNGDVPGVPLTVDNNGTHPWNITIPTSTLVGTYRIRIESDFITRISSTFKIVLDGKKSTILNTTADGVNLYPNPASDRLNVISDKFMNRVWLMNQLGKIVLESTVNANQVQLDVNGLSTGIYILKIESEGAVSSHKVMIR